MPDTAGVIAPPPLVALGAVLLGVALDWLMPAYVLTVLLSREERMVIGVLLIAGGVALAISGRGAFSAIPCMLAWHFWSQEWAFCWRRIGHW